MRKDRLDRDLSRIYEHALKVFETFDLCARYVDELLDGASNEKIRAEASSIQDASSKALIDTLPQLRDIWVVDANGAADRVRHRSSRRQRPICPTRPISSSIKTRKRGPFVSELIEGARQPADDFSRSATAAKMPDGSLQRRHGHFRAAPEYFASYYSALPQPAIASLVPRRRRDPCALSGTDGPRRQKLPDEPLMLKAIADNPDSGFVDGRLGDRRHARAPLPIADCPNTASMLRWGWIARPSSRLAARYGEPSACSEFPPRSHCSA